MHIPKNEIPKKVNDPGAVAPHKPDFGNAAGYGKWGGECFAMDAGTGIAPLLQGLKKTFATHCIGDIISKES